VSARDWSETFAYDGFGTVITTGSTDEATEVTRSSGPADPAGPTDRTLLRRSRRTDHEYDAAGRLVRTVRRTLDGRSRVWEYTWDSRDRLVRAVTPDHGVWRYVYDPMGRRSAKLRIDDEGTVVEQTQFSWDGPRVAEQHSQNADGTWVALTWDYEPDAFRLAAQRRRVWTDDADQHQIDEAFHAIVTDLVGTPTELVAPDGHVAWYTTTSVWGRTIATSADPDLDCPLRFPGQYHDPETGLNYNLHRYYSPDLASYITPDPLGLAPAPNDRAYVLNPLTFSDPYGLEYEGQKWVPDPNYSQEAIDARTADFAARYNEYNSIPEDIHDLVATYRANPNMAPRLNPDGSIDYFRGNNLSPKGKDFWQSWIHNPANGQTGAKIYWNGIPNSQARIMVHPTTGDIAWFPRTSSGGVHLYGSPKLYTW
jgi:RHS repeat-associated protein